MGVSPDGIGNNETLVGFSPIIAAVPENGMRRRALRAH
jgi:hypothetical protein